MNREILRLAIPNILSNLSIPLLSTVDIALMGRQEDAAYIGAIALGAVIFNFVYWSFGFLRMGTTGLTAQAYGAKSNTTIIEILGRALIFAILSSVLILLLQYPIFYVGLSLLEGSDKVETLVWTYCQIRIWDAPATLALYAFMGWFFGMQNTIYPLILTIFINVVNIIGSYIFVYHFGMAADGVALGTVIAQYSGLILACILWWYRYRSFWQYFSSKALQNWNALQSFFLLNRDIFIRTFCLLFVIAFFQNQSALQGDLILAVNSVLLQFFSWVSYGIDGFAYASESLVGKYVGAKDNTNLKQSIRYSFYWGFGLAVVYCIVFAVFGTDLLFIFSDKLDIIQAAESYLIWVILLPLLAVASFIWDGIFIGFTASKAMRDTMFLSTSFFLLSFYALMHFTTYPPNHILWFVFVSFMLIRGVIQYFWFDRLRLAVGS